MRSVWSQSRRPLCRFLSATPASQGSLPVSDNRDQVPRRGDPIYVAMSGGVDSAVAAALLKHAGHDIQGIFMHNWLNDARSPGGCRSDADWRDVQAVARVLKIPVTRIDLSREYWTRVFEPALRQFELGETPNPDIACNREIKFGALIDAIEQRASHQGHRCGSSSRWWLAMGHYTRAVQRVMAEDSSSSSSSSSSTRLMRCSDRGKDQTYFLSTVTQRALARCTFPLHPYTKAEVRRMAYDMGLAVARKADSQGLCFVSPDTRHFRAFLASYLVPSRITYVTEQQHVLHHDERGIWAATIGERSGLALPQGTTHMAGKWYVSAKDRAAGTMTLVKGAQHASLFKAGAVSRDWRWMMPHDAPCKGEGENYLVQLRHRQEPVACTWVAEGRTMRIAFREPQRSVAPGQHLALWQGDVCLGGGTIAQSID